MALSAATTFTSAPSASTLKAARTAANSPHALINITRLIRSLDQKIPATDPDDSPLVETDTSAIERKKDWESLLYCRAVLDLLKDRNEGSSTSSHTVQDMSANVDGIIARYEATLGPISLTSRPTSPFLQPVRSNTAYTQKSAEAPQRPAVLDAEPTHTQDSDPAPSIQPTSRRRRKAPSLSDYLSKRETEDAQGGETGLLALKPAPRQLKGDGKTSRDQLLAGQRSEGVMGNSQLHEELGGQLAEMSHRLKLNAIHFANSLEGEKALLDSSQQVLESNLVATQASKKQLGTVASKGRGTTCLTLGVILLVLIIFVWTYMLIRFT